MELKAQSKWRWLIAAYLFLAGLGGGAYFTGVITGLFGDEWAQISRIGVALGFPCVAVGSVFLIADLGTKKNFWRAFMRPRTSWVARGTIIISIFMVLSAIHLFFWIWPFRGLEDATGARQFIGALGALFAFGTMIYTGILVGVNRPIAFWSTAMVPLLFLVSALSTGIMAIMLIASLSGGGHGGPIIGLARVDMLIILVEIIVLIFYLQATHRVPESRASAKLVLTGSVAPLFWFGVALLGLLVPFTFEMLSTYAINGAGAGAVTIVATVCGLFGGLFLRQVVLAGGILAPLRAGRFEFALP